MTLGEALADIGTFLGYSVAIGRTRHFHFPLGNGRGIG
jgi:hypothetical protein